MARWSVDHQPKILVIAQREAPQFAMLAGVPHVLTYDTADAAAMRNSEIILQWSGTRDMLREAFAGCPALRWIHSRYAGVDSYLFPELVNSDVVLTNWLREPSRPGGFSAVHGDPTPRIPSAVGR